MMSILIDVIRGLFGAKPDTDKDDFANLDPSDPADVWRANHDIDRAERAGDVTVAYRKHGIKNEDHWEQVQASFNRRHGETPEYALAAATVSFNAQVERLSQPDQGPVTYRMPSEYLEPVEGFGLDTLAIAKARAEYQGPEALAQMGMDTATLGRVEAGWAARMGGSADPTAAGMLKGLYHTYTVQARAVLSGGK